MMFFSLNFVVKNEQQTDQKRPDDQTDAENPYKTAIIARHRPELRHQKRQNECRISLKTKQHQDRTNRVFPNARRPEGQSEKTKAPTSGPLQINKQSRLHAETHAGATFRTRKHTQILRATKHKHETLRLAERQQRKRKAHKGSARLQAKASRSVWPRCGRPSSSHWQMAE